MARVQLEISDLTGNIADEPVKENPDMDKVRAYTLGYVICIPARMSARIFKIFCWT